MAMRRLEMTGGILSYFTRHGTAANLLLVLLLALGIAAAPRMRAQFFPDVVIDGVSVSVAWDGAGAEDVDAAIVAVLEPVLLAIEGVESSRSTSSEGRAAVRLEFEPGWDMARAADDVTKAVDAAAGNLPDGAEAPDVRRGAWRDRVTDVVISGPVGVDQLARFSDEFVTRLFQAGVTRTSIRGIAAPETVVEVPSLNLVRFDVTMAEIAAAVAAQADSNPAGDVGAGTRLRTGARRRTADQIEAVAIRTAPDGATLTVGDVATVREDAIDRNRAYFVGDHPAISIRIDRSDRGDAIKIQRQVEDVAARMQASLPQGVHIDLIRTRAEAISGRLNILFDNGVLGLALVVTLLFLFLNARTAFWVAAGIPVAMTAAIALMYAFGLTLNMVSLFALIITLGIVVDDAIVVGEHADHRARRLGEGPVDAAENAARVMFPPVLSATLTTVIAFFGLMAIGGRFGDLISDIPFTVIVVLIASLIECFLILPNHMAHSIAHASRQHWYDWPSRQVNRGFGWFRERIFRRLVLLVIRLRYPVMAGVVALLALQVSAFIRGDVQWRFFSAPEQGSISANFAMLPGATREDSLAMMRLLQGAVADLGDRYEQEHGRNPVTYALAEVGGNTGRGLAGAGTKESYQLGSIAIELIDADLRPYSSFQLVSDLQDSVPRHPALETLSFRRWGAGPGGDSLDVQIFGAATDTLKAAAEALKTRMADFPEVSALEDTLSYDKEELILDLTPQGKALGLNIDELGRVLRNRLNGIEAATFPVGPRTGAILVELPAQEQTADILDRMQIRTPAGGYVPLADVVTVAGRTGFSTVDRENGIRLVSVTGTISEDDPDRARLIADNLTDSILPALEEQFGVATRQAGLAEQESAFLNDALTGFVLCLVGIYIALAWIFASWTRPLVVMAVIPFGLVGTIYGHHAWGVPLSMFSVVGLIGMTGIIINDSIVLVTTIDQKAEQRGLIPAIVDGAADRLRAVILTTATTVLGLAPLLYESSVQAQFLKPTVITLCYGLGFGLVLVLMIVPALIAMQDDIRKLRRAARRALAPRRAGAAARAAWSLVALCAAGFATTIGAELVGQPALLRPLGEGPAAALASFLLLCLGGGVIIYAIAAFAHLRHRYRRP